ncbi:hypothetical protein MHYP_G00086090 [Metynnis hypsauchen]
MWLPREISGVIVTTVYIPPHADTDMVLRKLYEAVNRHKTVCKEAASLVVGDFNKANFREVAPKQKPKKVPLTLREVHHRLDQSDSSLRNCFDDTDWEILRGVKQ